MIDPIPVVLMALVLGLYMASEDTTIRAARDWLIAHTFNPIWGIALINILVCIWVMSVYIVVLCLNAVLS